MNYHSILYYLDEVTQRTCFQAVLLPSIPRSVELFLANKDYFFFNVLIEISVAISKFRYTYRFSGENRKSLTLWFV